MSKALNALVMVVNAGFATAVTPRRTLLALRGATPLLLLLAAAPTAAAHPHLVGLVDLRAATALLLGGLPVIAVLRRRPVRITDRAHARAYTALLVLAAAAMLPATASSAGGAPGPHGPPARHHVRREEPPARLPPPAAADAPRPS